MAFVSFDMVKQILKDCEGKTFVEAMDSVAIGGYLPNGRVMVDRDGKITAIDCFPRIDAPFLKPTKSVPAPTGQPILPSIPKVSEADRMWNLVVLAARSSRYEE
jgi:hypothetical protein